MQGTPPRHTVPSGCDLLDRGFASRWQSSWQRLQDFEREVANLELALGAWGAIRDQGFTDD